jgi:hypothetical protein
MKDGRLMLARKALEGLIDSLDATVRVHRWLGTDAIPEPLSKSASLLLPRLGAADKLLAQNFTGAMGDVTRMDAMSAAIRHLDEAYVTYRKHVAARPTESDTAAMTLDTIVCEVKATSARW